jgi:hypothetical protein
MANSRYHGRREVISTLPILHLPRESYLLSALTDLRRHPSCFDIPGAGTIRRYLTYGGLETQKDGFICYEEKQTRGRFLQQSSTDATPSDSGRSKLMDVSFTPSPAGMPTVIDVETGLRRHPWITTTSLRRTSHEMGTKTPKDSDD